jgi:hypothetical protein
MTIEVIYRDRQTNVCTMLKTKKFLSLSRSSRTMY